MPPRRALAHASDESDNPNVYETLRGRLHHLDLPLFEYASPTLPEWDAVLELIAVGRDLPADARLVRVATPVRS